MYEISTSDKYTCLSLKNSSEHSFLDDIGKLRNSSAELVDSEPTDRQKELPDFPGFYSRGILMSENAKEILEGLFSRCGTWVEMKYAGKKLYYFLWKSI